MRRTTAVLAALTMSALALTGCGAAASDGAAADCSRKDSAALAASVDVSGAFGTPTPSVDIPVRTAHTIYTDVIDGEGPRIATPTQDAILARVLVNGSTGEPIHSALSVWSPQSASAELAGVGDALECAAEGSRVVAAVPADALPEGMGQQVGLGPNDSLVAVYDVRYVLRPKAEGRSVFNDARGLPTVVRAPDGRPGVIVPDHAAPTKAAVQTLIEGDGAIVGTGAPMVQFTAVDWADRSVTRTSWDDGVLLDTSSLPEEVVAAISDAAVGSQLMVVVPGDDADATVYVVDVLGIIPEELTRG